MSTRDELVALQKKLVNELKQRIYQAYGRRNPELDRYYRDYQREFRSGFERHASRAEVVGTLARKHIAYFGDYHTLYSAQSEVLSLLREVATRHDRKVVLALEMLHAADMGATREYMAGRLLAREFRKRVKWRRSWGFPWRSFGRFFELAHDHDMPVYGLNINADQREDNLATRDEFAADLVAALTLLYPERLIAVVYGDLHLAGKHLPALVDARLARHGLQRRSVRVYQNSETVYWELVQRRLEHVVDAVKLRENVYCVMNATPLVKFQSFVNWQDHIQDLALSGLEDLDPEMPGENVLLGQVAGFVRQIAAFLDLKLDDPAAFELATAADLNFLADLVQRKLYSASEIKALKGYLQMAETAWFARARILYLGNLSVGHAAEAAMKYILGSLRPPGKGVVDARDDFYGRIMVEALAFFGSKIINPKRKAAGRAEWLAVIERLGRKRNLPPAQQLEVRVARQCLAHDDYARAHDADPRTPPPARIYDLPTRLHVAVTRALGRQLGERMFCALEKDAIDRQAVRQAMADDVRKAEQCRLRYMQMRHATDPARMERRDEEE